MSAPAIRTEHLRKRYRLGQRGGYRVLGEAISGAVRRGLAGSREADPARYVWALQDISFEVGQGEILGVIGRNGAGKSTLLKVLSGITEPTEGRAEINGRVGALLEVGTGFHPELTGRENVYLNGAILGMRKSEINQKFDEIVGFSGVARFIDTPLKFYSSGMAVRLGFAVAAYLEPEILVVDEVLAVGDIEFQERCLGRMQDVANSGRTVLFVSHNMEAISMFCPNAMWLEAGRIAYTGPSGEAIKRYADASRPGHDTWLGGGSRIGSGQVRATSLWIEDPAGERVSSVEAGGPVRFVLEYETAPDADLAGPLSVNFVVGTGGNRGLVSFMSDVSAEPFRDVPPRGRVVCDVPSLPLMPGHYNLQFSCLLNRDLGDKVHQAASLVVTHGDFFGTGRLPPQTQVFGPFLAHNSFTLEALAPVAVEAGTG